MKEMFVCPNCKRVTKKENIILIKSVDGSKDGVLDKLSGFFFENKPVYRCNDCLNSK